MNRYDTILAEAAATGPLFSLSLSSDANFLSENAMKQAWKPGTVVYPLPAVLVSCGATPDEYNLVTVAWTGTVCTSPPMCYISLRPERHSYGIIRRTGEFVINLTTERMARAVDWCGVKSGPIATSSAKRGSRRLRPQRWRLRSWPKRP